MNLQEKIDQISKAGFGVAWHPLCNEFRPFGVEDETIVWWDDPSQITKDHHGNDVERAWQSLYEEIKTWGLIR